MLVGKSVTLVICEKPFTDKIGFIGKAIAVLLGVRGIISNIPFSVCKGCFFCEQNKKGIVASKHGCYK